MSSYLRTIADALAIGLQSVTWAVSGTTVTRRNWAAIDVEDMATPAVIVVPGGVDITRISRISVQADYTVNVFIGRQVQTDSSVNAMFDLADAVLAQVRAHSFSGVTWPSGVTGPTNCTLEINPGDAMTDRNVWRAVVVATYRVIESIPLTA